MEVKLFSIYDKKAKVFNPPMSSVNQGTLLRTLSDQLERADNLMSRFAQDYDVYEIGYFDDLTGDIQVNGKPGFVCCLEDLITPVKEKENVSINR